MLPMVRGTLMCLTPRIVLTASGSDLLDVLRHRSDVAYARWVVFVGVFVNRQFLCLRLFDRLRLSGKHRADAVDILLTRLSDAWFCPPKR